MENVHKLYEKRQKLGNFGFSAFFGVNLRRVFLNQMHMSLHKNLIEQQFFSR